MRVAFSADRPITRNVIEQGRDVVVRALVVEDDKDLNRQLSVALADAGFAVDTAAALPKPTMRVFRKTRPCKISVLNGR